MGIDVILRVAGIGILVAIICMLLKQTGREDMAMLAAIAGLIITFAMIVSSMGELFNSVRDIFELY